MIRIIHCLIPSFIPPCQDLSLILLVMVTTPHTDLCAIPCLCLSGAVLLRPHANESIIWISMTSMYKSIKHTVIKGHYPRITCGSSDINAPSFRVFDQALSIDLYAHVHFAVLFIVSIVGSYMQT